MNQTPLNIISAKALEKQLKVVEGRISVLQSEISELEKIKNACLVLLGNNPEAAPLAETAAAPKAKKKKVDSGEEEVEVVDVISPRALLDESDSENTSPAH